MKTDITRLYFTLLTRAQKRCDLKVATHTMGTLASAAIWSKPPQQKAEAKLDAAHITALKQNIVDLRQIITILAEDNSKRLKPILESILTLSQLTADRNQQVIPPTAPLSFSTRDLANSDLKQLRGMMLGVRALKTLAEIYSTTLRPEFTSVLSKLQIKFAKEKDLFEFKQDITMHQFLSPRI